MKGKPWRILITNVSGNPLGDDVDAREVIGVRTDEEIKHLGWIGVNRTTGEPTWQPHNEDFPRVV